MRVVRCTHLVGRQDPPPDPDLIHLAVEVAEAPTEPEVFEREDLLGVLLDVDRQFLPVDPKLRGRGVAGPGDRDVVSGAGHQV